MIYILIILNSYSISIIVIFGYPFCALLWSRRRPLLFKNEVSRVMPHRGDYTVTHRIDGRLDPGSCYRCHGNRNDVKCRQDRWRHDVPPCILSGTFGIPRCR